MKMSAAISLSLTPLALAKSVHELHHGRGGLNDLAVRTLQSNARGNHEGQATGGNKDDSGLEDQAEGPKAKAKEPDVIVIWLNPGGGAPKMPVGEEKTVTATVTATVGAVATAAGNAAVAGATHMVTVGGAAGLAFDPPSVKAAIGDFVVFSFMSLNHSATQSSFDKPCVKLPGGMDSGFMPNPNNAISPAPQMAMQVMVDTPLWFYCKQKTGNHCGKGMVFSINPTAQKTQAMFQQMAIAQNGTGSGGAITGNDGKKTGAAGGAATPTGTSGNARGAATPAAGKTGNGSPKATGAVNPGSLQPGTGKLKPDGSCDCVAVCQAGSFPALSQGVASFGGVPGALPANMLMT